MLRVWNLGTPSTPGALSTSSKRDKAMELLEAKTIQASAPDSWLPIQAKSQQPGSYVKPRQPGYPSKYQQRDYQAMPQQPSYPSKPQQPPTQIVGIFKSKPLGYVSSDLADHEPVTPNQLLMGRWDASIPQAVYGDSDLISRRRLRHSQILADPFWPHFIRDYLPILQTR